jgi:hypothetical protein
MQCNRLILYIIIQNMPSFLCNFLSRFIWQAIFEISRADFVFSQGCVLVKFGS